MHCVSLSYHKDENGIGRKAEENKSWEQKVTAIVLNDKVDNSQSALLNITFWKKCKSSGRHLLKRRVKSLWR